MDQSVIDADTGIFAQEPLVHLPLKADSAFGQRFDFIEEPIGYDENGMVSCRKGKRRVFELRCQR